MRSISWYDSPGGEESCNSQPIAVWEHLTIERGWTNEQHVQRITMALKKALVQAA